MEKITCENRREAETVAEDIRAESDLYAVARFRGELGWHVTVCWYAGAQL